VIRSHQGDQRGFTLIEVIVAVLVLAVGISAIVAVFPTSLRAARDAEDITRATLLAQRKAEEIRRDDDRTQNLIRSIASLATPTLPIVFPEDPSLAYAFSGSTIKYQGETGPEADSNVPRVFVIRASETQFTPPLPRSILVELRFGP
jgi:prepilin-type N-terminal cleavage/methylation domain-containing protein